MNADFDPAAYGESAASVYDQLYPAIESGLLAALIDLSGAGPVLDLGCGTGRVAIPLARAGVDVHGVEASAAMISVFRAQAGHELVALIEGDFAAVDLGDSFQLIFCLVSTFHLLPTLDLQRACLRNIAAHLRPGGRFICEAYENKRAFPHALISEIPVTTIAGDHCYRTKTLSTPPDILDSIASEAGLGLVERWSTWSRVPHDAESPRHISIYRLASPDVM